MRAEILGSAQDGGVPHLGCSCDACSRARDDPSLQRSAASLRVFDADRDVNYIFDVSPDIRHHVGDEFIDGVFLSHAHLGHITGLLYFGKEAFNADEVPLYCSETVAEFLRETSPYRTLIDRENIILNEFGGSPVSVMGMRVRPVPVENRGYLTTDTHAFTIETGDTRLFYMTDIDRWTEDAVAAVEDADIAVVDGCFWSSDEIDRYENVPHPPVEETLEELGHVDTDVYLTHMNHTNPVLLPDADERQQVEDAGFTVADDGMEIQL
ncbi:MAG: MBL fold metallo-hydrolase [Candidatus Nanohaloarchaea archaeon]|nr:MBL fold metallo-hydrolase [Candidatus Nanohaloarchaea archaeon]